MFFIEDDTIYEKIVTDTHTIINAIGAEKVVKQINNELKWFKFNLEKGNYEIDETVQEEIKQNKPEESQFDRIENTLDLLLLKMEGIL